MDIYFSTQQSCVAHRQHRRSRSHTDIASTFAVAAGVAGEGVQCITSGGGGPVVRPLYQLLAAITQFELWPGHKFAIMYDISQVRLDVLGSSTEYNMY